MQKCIFVTSNSLQNGSSILAVLVRLIVCLLNTLCNVNYVIGSETSLRVRLSAFGRSVGWAAFFVAGMSITFYGLSDNECKPVYALCNQPNTIY